jgi:hypothetical protein
VTYISGLDHWRLSAVAGLVQYLLYAAAVYGLARVARPLDPRLAWATLAGLLLNPFLLAQVTDALTEGLTLGLFVTIVLLTLQAARAQTTRAYALAVGGACFLVATTLMVRPANVVLVCAWHGAMLVSFLFLRTAGGHRTRLKRLGVYLVATVLAALVVWMPQAAYNHAFAGRAAFPLVCQLGDLQLTWGIVLWRYETLLAVTDAAPWYYPNPLFKNNLPDGAMWQWYLNNPRAGLATMAAHVFNSFSIHYLFTYVPDLNPWHTWPLRTTYWLATIFGGYQLARLAGSWLFGGSSEVPRRYGAVILFLGLTLAGTLALNSITAVEARFNVLPIAILCVAAAYFVLELAARPRAIFTPGFAVLCVVVLLCVAGSAVVDRLGTGKISAAVPIYNLAEGQCFYSIDKDPHAWKRIGDSHRARFSNLRLSGR